MRPNWIHGYAPAFSPKAVQVGINACHMRPGRPGGHTIRRGSAWRVRLQPMRRGWQKRTAIFQAPWTGNLGIGEWCRNAPALQIGGRSCCRRIRTLAFFNSKLGADYRSKQAPSGGWLGIAKGSDADCSCCKLKTAADPLLPHNF